MNLDKLNQWLSILGNLAVLAGIAFLAIEIQQNSDMMESQIRDSLASELTEWQMALATDSSVAKIWQDGGRGIAFDPNTGDAVAYSMMAQSNLRIWENELYQFQKGLYTGNEFLPRTNRWKAIMQNTEVAPGYLRLWCRQSNVYSLEFQQLINSFINEVTSCEDIQNSY